MTLVGIEREPSRGGYERNHLSMFSAICFLSYETTIYDAGHHNFEFELAMGWRLRPRLQAANEAALAHSVASSLRLQRTGGGGNGGDECDRLVRRLPGRAAGQARRQRGFWRRRRWLDSRRQRPRRGAAGRVTCRDAGGGGGKGSSVGDGCGGGSWRQPCCYSLSERMRRPGLCGGTFGG
jgi:hypothetical protein